MVDIEESTSVEWCFFDEFGTRYEARILSPFEPEPIFETLRRAAPWAGFSETTVRARDQPQTGFGTARVLCVAFLGLMIAILSMAFLA